MCVVLRQQYDSLVGSNKVKGASKCLRIYLQEYSDGHLVFFNELMSRVKYLVMHNKLLYQILY